MNITYSQIRSFKPCYTPLEIGMPSNYEASLPDFIVAYRNRVKNKDDILWVLLRTEFLNNKDIKLFAVWCAGQVQHLMTDHRSLNALNIAEVYAFGVTTKTHYIDHAAADAAADAAWSAASAAARASSATGAASAASAAATAAAWAASAASANVWVASAASAAAIRAAGAASAAVRAAGGDEGAQVDTQINMLLKVLDSPDGEWFKLLGEKSCI